MAHNSITLSHLENGVEMPAKVPDDTRREIARDVFKKRLHLFSRNCFQSPVLERRQQISDDI
jgi:hypothetical protein